MADYQLHEASKKGDVVSVNSLILYGGLDPNGKDGVSIS
jgi:hypothetical protein